MKLEGFRREYDRDQLDESSLPDDPLKLFAQWLEEASRSENPDPTAMTLSTVDEQGTPSSRIVLLKKIEAAKLIFFTNYRSRKAKEITKKAGVSVHFYWPELERQVKISGIAEHLDESESDLYFASRPFESKVSAWASPQSEIVPDREFLEQSYEEYRQKFEGSDHVPRPKHWGGFAIAPLQIEFWQGGRLRLHDRMLYTLRDSSWSRVRLAP